MRNLNALWIGLAAGLLVPFVGYAIILMLDEQFGLTDDMVGGPDANLQERTRALLAICLSIIPLQVFKRNRADQSIRGLVLMTLVYAGIWFYYYGSKLLG